MAKQDYLMFLLLAFLIVGLFITTLIVKNRQEIRSKAVGENKVNLLITSPVSKVTPGSQFTIRVRYKPNGKSVSGIETHISYPANLIEIVSGPSIESDTFPTILQNKVDIENGKIHLAAGIKVVTPTPKTSASGALQLIKPIFAQDADTEARGNPLFATIIFKVKDAIPDSTDKITISFIPKQQIITVIDKADNFVGTLTDLSLPIERITGAQPNLTFKIKFRSVNGDVGNQKVIVKTKKGNTVKEFKDITVTHTGAGTYKAEDVPLTGLAAGTYKIYVKGPKHLAKSFGTVELINGNNTFSNWAEVELEPGDTPIQDGIINSQDISRIIDRLEVVDPSTNDLQTADLNYDGAINGADINELIVTLGTKFDEDKY